jgi:H+/Cl- antiporter ClcA
MQNILNTRKTVKYYILINLIFIAFALFYSFYVIFNSDEYESLMTNLGENGPILLWSIVVFAILFVVGIMFLFYSLLYGLLIKKLNKNYKELTEEV